MTLFGAEFLWCRQRGWCDDYQRLVNRQSRAITVILQSAPAGVVVREAGL